MMSMIGIHIHLLIIHNVCMLKHKVKQNAFVCFILTVANYLLPALL